MTNSQPSPCAWADNLRPGDILAFRFPHGEADDSVKSRPCVVLAVQNMAEDIDVTVAYGTTATSAANRGLELWLRDGADWQAAGLRRPTRFVLARRLTVPSIDPRFDFGASNDPMIGRLPDHALSRLAQLTGFLGPALTDDRHRGRSTRSRHGRAPDRRRSVITERREIAIAGTGPRTRSRQGNAPRTVVVEHRRKRLLRPIPSAA